MHNFGRYPRREIAMSYPMPAGLELDHSGVFRAASAPFIRAIRWLYRTLDGF